MRYPNPTRSAPTRLLAGILTWTFVLGQVMQPVYAQTTPLGDVPIAAKVAAKPNIVYTLDDSGSMNLNFLPDFVTAANTATNPAFCRGGIQVSGLGEPYYNKDATSTFNVTTAACGGGGASFTTPFNFPAFYASDFNHLAYNPGVTYTPPIKADGTPLTSAFTDAAGNQTNLATVQTDPFNSPASTANLTTNVDVPIYCNSDWPLIGTQPYDGFSTVASLVLGDVGDAAGENPSLNPAFGKHCRINGTAYAAGGFSPAITDDYNYPWPKVGAVINTVGKPNDRAYYWRSSNLRQLWCDKTNTAWPQSCNGGWSCTKGGKYTPPAATQPQTCYFAGSADSCTAWSTTYAPSGCNTNPAYDLGGCVASLEQTCLTCSATTTCIASNPYDYGYCHLTANGGPPGSGGDGSFCYCWGTGCALPACPTFAPAPTNANCSKGVLTQKCNASGGDCNDVLFDPVTLTNVPAGTTLLQDSNLQNGGTGAVCRHNNFNYGAGAFPDTYPSGVWNTPVSASCPTFPTTASIPRHYYVVDSVDFCATVNTTANAQWQGFGTSACQKKNDFATHKYVKYGQFHRTDLIPARNYPYVDLVTGIAGTRTYAQEAINYGNWYAYYRTRILAGKTTSSIAFSFLDDTYRVGFHNLGTKALASGGADPIWVDVGDFKGTAAGTTRYDWYQTLFGINVTNYSTFTMNALLRIGNLFEAGSSAGVSASGVNPLPAAAKDPIQYSCQSNYHILFTDGFTNQPTLPTAAWVGDQDASVPAAFPLAIPVVAPQIQEHNMPNLQAILGQPWPKPFVQQTAVIPNTLADIATYYWATDLRDAANPRSKNTLKNDVPAWSSPASELCSVGNPCPPLVPADLDWTKDVAWWQHVNFSAISFGSEGTLDASNPNATVACIKAGAASGVAGSPCQSSVLTWPDLTKPNQPVNPVANQGAAGVDDLWHATVNSRGTFVYAKSPVEVAYGLASILAGISNQRKARSGASFSGQVLDNNNNVIFQPTIEPGWAGDLIKIQIDPITGTPLPAPVNGVWWNAAKELAKQIDPVATGKAEPWMDELNRRVVTLTGPSGPGVPFRDTSLTVAQLQSLSPIAAVQSRMIKYLRGGNVDGATIIEGTKPGQFRKRFGALGDISNAQPVIVGPPNRHFTDPGYGCAPFDAVSCPVPNGYALAKVARPTVIVAPANDGMVHVFDAGPMPPAPVSAGGGTELFAFIPRTLMRGVAGSVATEDVTALQALTYQDGGVPIYHHHMYVDSSPRAADIDFSPLGGGLWHTIVIGGLGKGGNSYYALDLTDVAVPNEATAAAKVMWEWNNPDSDVLVGDRLIPGGNPGFTYGRPVIVKVRDSAYPNGRWVAIVTGGYNNLSHMGKVFFLDAKTGTLLATVTTPPDPGGKPIELAQTHAFVKNQTNQTAEQIYGGDLLGNVWRIDVSATDSYKTASAVLFAQLTDPGGTGQPVTTAPQIEIDINNGIDRYVFVGTGRLLHPDDLTTPAVPQQQTMYAIRDGTLTTILPPGPPLPIQPRAPGMLKSIDIGSNGINAIAGGAPNGWYHDLPNNLADPIKGAQRIVVDPQASVNIAAYVGTKIQDDPCVISLPAFLYARDYTSGRSLAETCTPGPNPVCTVQSSLFFPGGAVGVQLVGRTQLDGSLSLGAIVSGEIPGTTPVDIVNPVTGPGIRWSWRLLTGE